MIEPLFLRPASRSCFGSYLGSILGSFTALMSALLLSSVVYAQTSVESRLSSDLSLDNKPSAGLSEDLSMSLVDRQISGFLEEGARYEHGEGVTRDSNSAQRAYCAAIDLGSSDAMIRLGWMFANGRGVARDDLTAAAFFKQAAEAGNPMGERLASMIRLSGSATAKPNPCARFTSSSNTTKGSMTQNNRAAGTSPLAVNLPSIKLGEPALFRKPMSSNDQKQLTLNILKMAGQFKLDPRLVLAVIQQESAFDPNAQSPKNAQGLMQLIPETAERFGVKNAFEPLENVRGGMAYLRWLLSYFKGDVSLVLAAYNAGEGTIDKYKGVPPFAETLAYVQRIRALYPFDRHPFDAKASAGRVSFVR
jgi:Transglycosylase SLT domain/Sel1 repeat